MNHRVRNSLRVGFLVPVLVLALTACFGSGGGDSGSAQDHARQVARDRQNYQPVNDVEGHNYNARQELADQPSTIIWCTAYPSNPNAKPFTVPIVGKLTSGNKRPYATSVAEKGSDDHRYTPEVPGPDGFYGTSGEYRYGFDPAGNYQDFYNLETYCTSVPNVIQKNTTDIAITYKGDLNQADKQAQDALVACRRADPDPSKPCPQAAAILGVER
ncbi:MAG: hypothetical protein ACXWLH_03375 [Candidatus Saccharimonadales bacterium]